MITVILKNGYQPAKSVHTGNAMILLPVTHVFNVVPDVKHELWMKSTLGSMCHLGCCNAIPAMAFIIIIQSSPRIATKPSEIACHDIDIGFMHSACLSFIFICIIFLELNIFTFKVKSFHKTRLAINVIMFIYALSLLVLSGLLTARKVDMEVDSDTLA
uniref:Uncharacterized protein n=1 Tax=Glossina austeni TaxID=7395 RepID=A0A1A9VLS0_GLOAU